MRWWTNRPFRRPPIQQPRSRYSSAGAPKRRSTALQTSISRDPTTPITIPRTTRARLSGIGRVPGTPRDVPHAAADHDVAQPDQRAHEPDDLDSADRTNGDCG